MNIRFTKKLAKNIPVLCGIWAALLILLLSNNLVAQTTVTIYPGTSTYQTGRTTTTTRTSGSIWSTDVAGGVTVGYAVFDLSSIPAGALITNCVIDFNVTTYGGSGTPSGWATYGYPGDLSLVTDPATLFADCSTGSILTNATYGTAIGDIQLSTTDNSDTFISHNIGGVVSICFTGGGTRTYKMTGYTGTHATTGTHAPYLQITYLCSPAGTAGIISGQSTVCSGSPVTLSENVSGGQWFSMNSNALATDSVITGLSTGVDTIFYVVNSACGADTAYFPITINPTSSAGTITGTASLCTSATPVAFSTTGNAGGTWGTVNTNASVDVTGNVTALAEGTDSVYYAASGCVADTAWYAVNITHTPGGGIMSGNTNVCLGGTTLLTVTGDAGGVWTGYDNSIATVNDTGLVFGVSVNNVTIAYQTSNTCGTFYYPFNVNVISLPVAGTINTPTSICPGGSATLTAAGTPGGQWYITAGPATIDLNSGLLSATDSGTVFIDYVVANTCISDTAHASFTIHAAPHAGPLTGGGNFCTLAATTVVSAGDPGGSWSSSNATVASVDGGGNVSANAAGTATITYIVSNSCTADTAYTTMSIADPVTAGTITGVPATLCVGTTSTLATTGSAGGTWTVDPLATIGAASGAITGVSWGTGSVSYTISNSCNSDVATAVVNVDTNVSAGTISGQSLFCVPASTLLTTTSAAAGTWYTTDNTVAAIVPTGGNAVNVFMNATGSAVISFAASNVCGTDSTTFAINVGTAVSAGVITAPGSICQGRSDVVTTTGSTGGTWSSLGYITINPVTGGIIATDPGQDTIMYKVTGCNSDSAMAAITVIPAPHAGSITGQVNFCIANGSTVSSNGDAGGTWTTSDNTIASIDGSGNITGNATGTVTISYISQNSCGADTAYHTISVLSPVTGGTISAVSSLCVGIDYHVTTDGTPGGTWLSTANATIDASGIVHAVAPGIDTISYAVHGCNKDTSRFYMTINPLAHAGTIAAPAGICNGTTITLTANGDASGAWSSNDAAVSVNATTGAVTALSDGTATITYIVANSCSADSAYASLSITDSVHAGVVAGPSTLCIGTSPVTLSATGTTGGIWYSSPEAAVDAVSGNAVGISAGTASVSYTISGCNNDTAYLSIPVNPLPVAGTLSGSNVVGLGTTTTLTAANGGGTWTVTNSNATVNSGVVTGVITGIDTIVYTITNVCGADSASFVDTILNCTTANAGNISGTSEFCQHLTIPFTTTGNAGTWSSTSANASVDASGNVTGVSPGTATIAYIVANACGTDTARVDIIIDPAAVAGTISGTNTVCSGMQSSLSVTGTLGAGGWSSSDNTVASVDPAGVVTGQAAGTADIRYIAVNSCSIDTAIYSFTVNQSPDAGTVSGSSPICAGAPATPFTTTGAAGGSWTTDNGFASVDGSGNVTGVSAGISTVSYTVFTAFCGSASAIQTITVNPAAAAGTITGANAVCTGLTATLAVTGTVGAASWSSSNNTVASVDPAGVVTGQTAGTANIRYIAVTSCSIDTAIYSFTVNQSPDAGTISGSSPICAGAPATPFTTTGAAGGSWTTNNGFASVDGSGNVTGVSAGISTVSYTVFTAFCGSASATQTITVNPAPSAGVISGSSNVCSGSFVSLTVTGSIGIESWSSQDNVIASVDASGNVTGNTVGTTTITHSVTNSCGTAYSTFTINVTSGAVPSAGTITGPTHVCIGSDIILDDATATSGGVWSSSDNTIASVDPTGDVFAYSPGPVVISYTINTGCFVATATYNVTVDNVPYGGAVTGTNDICIGSPYSLTDPTGDLGGNWTSSNTVVASVDGSGNVTGLTSGTTLISYEVSNTCGSSTATYPVTVEPTPAGGTITGSSSVCVAASISLGDLTGTPGGTWSSSIPANASVDAAGHVTGNLAGATVISYTFTNICGTAAASFPVTVNPLPAAGTLSGPSSVCVASGITLLNTGGTPGGAWTSSDNTLATVDASGNVTGVGAGNVTISYTGSTVCGNASATYAVTVNPLPDAGAITGLTAVCEGATISLANATALAGGTWSSSAPANASVDASGVVSGHLAGSTVITYLSATACGSASNTYGITINPLPVSGTITGATAVCTGTTFTLSDTAPLGSWSSDNTTAATVDAGGVVSGLTAGIANIDYTVTNGCGTSAATIALTVNTTPDAGTISGTVSLCVVATTTLTGVNPGGNWSSSNSAIAAVDASGVVTAAAQGAVTINYTLTSLAGCSDTAAVSGNIYNVPVVSAISGSSAVCLGLDITLTDTATYGTWSSSNTAVATVNSATGVVTGVTNGTVTITYFETNPAGCSAQAVFTVASGGTFPATYLLPLGSATICDSAVQMSVVSLDSNLSYQWYHNGTAMAGYTDSAYLIDTPGIYSVVVSHGCLTETLPAVTILAPPHPVIGLSGTDLLYTGSYTTYQWYLNGSPIPGAVSSVHVASTPGVYSVEVTDGNGCPVMSAPDTLLTLSVPGVTVSGSSIRVYPNPATTSIHIDATVTVNVSIMTTLGKIAIEKKDASDIDISGLANGMYMIMIYDEHNNLLRSDKLIKTE